VTNCEDGANYSNHGEENATTANIFDGLDDWVIEWMEVLCVCAHLLYDVYGLCEWHHLVACFMRLCGWKYVDIYCNINLPLHQHHPTSTYKTKLLISKRAGIEDVHIISFMSRRPTNSLKGADFLSILEVLIQSNIYCC
jgi:hypothetical protein